jgi:hypothetical protein
MPTTTAVSVAHNCRLVRTDTVPASRRSSQYATPTDVTRSVETPRTTPTGRPTSNDGQTYGSSAAVTVTVPRPKAAMPARRLTRAVRLCMGTPWSAVTVTPAARSPVVRTPERSLAS